MEAEIAIRLFPPYAAFTVYDHHAQITRTLSNTQYNFQSRETAAQTAPNQAWIMRSGMYCRGTFRMIEPPTIPPQALNILRLEVEVSWSPAFVNVRADLPPNFILCSLRPIRGGNWIESRNPPPPYNWAVPRNVPQPEPVNQEEEEVNNHEEVEEDREVEEEVREQREEEPNVVIVEDDSHAEEEVQEDRRSEDPREYYDGGQESEVEEEYQEEYREEEGEEEEVTIVEEITEEQIFGTPARSRNVPFTIFGPDGVIANPEDFILVESDESPIMNHGSSSGGVLIRVTRI